MSGVNKVILIGRLGQDPEVRSTTTGHQVCTLNIATSEAWSKDGNKEEKTEWHRVILWDRQAELAQKYLKKGRMVYIEGKLQTRSWQDKEGQKRFTTEIVANNMQFIDGGNSRGNDMGNDNAPMQDSPSDAMYYSGSSDPSSRSNSGSKFSSNSLPMDDDIPF